MTRDEMKKLENAANKLLEIKNVISELEKESKVYEAAIKELVGESEEVIYAGERRISYKTESRMSVDSKRLRDELEDVYDAYCKASYFRKLLVK